MLKNAGIIALGPALGYAAAFFASPILTRLYSPTEFGIFTVYLALLSIFSPIVCGKLDVAIPLPDKTDTANNITNSAIVMIFITFLIILIGIFGFGKYFVRLTHTYGLEKYLWLIPITLLAVGGYQILMGWALRKRSFKAIAANGFQLKCMQVITQIIGGVFSLGTFGLILGYLLAQIGSIIVFILSIGTKDIHFIKNINFDELITTTKRYKKFSLLTGSAAMVNSIGSQLPSFFFVFLYGAHTVGLYGLVQRLIAVPITLVAQSMDQVYFVKTIELTRQDAQFMSKIFFYTLLKLALITFPIFIVLFLIGPELFGIIFGKTWAEAGVYLRILSVVCFAQMIATPFGSSLLALERQDLYFMREFGQISMLIIMFGVAYFFQLSVIHFLILFTVGEVIYYIFYILISWFAMTKFVNKQSTRKW